MKQLLTSLLFLLAIPIMAQDAAKKITKEEAAKLFNTIEPGKHIFGYPFGTSAEEFIEAEGIPRGYLNLKGDRTILIYGNSHGYVFTDNKLSGLRIMDPIADWILLDKSRKKLPRNDTNWKFSNGIHAQMKLTKLIETLGDDIKMDGNIFGIVEIGGCVVEITFFPTKNGDKEPNGRMVASALYIFQKLDKVEKEE